MTTSTTETQETAQATAVANEKPEPPKKANAREQKPHVAPSKGKSGKKTTPAKKGAKAPKKAKSAKAEGVRELPRCLYSPSARICLRRWRDQRFRSGAGARRAVKA